jgi:hypothetical protein
VGAVHAIEEAAKKSRVPCEPDFLPIRKCLFYPTGWAFVTGNSTNFAFARSNDTIGSLSSAGY